MSLATLDALRHRIPFWWWLTYDALVGVVIVAGISPRDPAFWLGLGVLAIAVVIDVVEFIVKRPSAREKLQRGTTRDGVAVPSETLPPGGSSSQSSSDA